MLCVENDCHFVYHEVVHQLIAVIDYRHATGDDDTFGEYVLPVEPMQEATVGGACILV